MYILGKQEENHSQRQRHIYINIYTTSVLQFKMYKKDNILTDITKNRSKMANELYITVTHWARRVTSFDI